MPNIPETVAAFLARTSIGDIWSAAAPDFGVESVVDRFAQIRSEGVDRRRRLPPGGNDFERERGPGDRVPTPELDRARDLWASARHPVAGDVWRRRRRRRRAQSRRAAVRHPLWVCSARGRPGCPSPSSTDTAASCLSTSKSDASTSTPDPATRRFGSPRRRMDDVEPPRRAPSSEKRSHSLWRLGHIRPLRRHPPINVAGVNHA
jgi:hypothetical protein